MSSDSGGKMSARSQSSSKSANLLAFHREDARSSFDRLISTPLSSAMTVIVIAIALLLPAFLLVVNANLESALTSFRESARITLYLNTNTDTEQGLEVSNNLLQREDIAGAEYISSDQAMAEFSARTGLENVLSGLSDNPLPAAIIVTPASNTAATVSGLASSLAELPSVDQVQVDLDWVQRAEAISSALAVLGRGLGAIFILGVGFIVGNTIKLGVEHRKDEIRVIKLVGGTDRFVARPFLYTGLYYGAAGGLLAALMLQILVFAVALPLQSLASEMMAGPLITGPGLSGFLLLIVGGGLIGWCAALLASWHHIRLIDP